MGEILRARNGEWHIFSLLLQGSGKATLKMNAPVQWALLKPGHSRPQAKTKKKRVTESFPDSVMHTHARKLCFFHSYSRLRNFLETSAIVNSILHADALLPIFTEGANGGYIAM